ncbi:CsbD family protein [Zavarzinia aquatilis]|uniref:CsbD family protein n=1 Tax=Zavarzinia aquatilis TaxID=2211142 RepID=A0A317E1R5_9PROT|nr:CsbD family protein [Zavarzinia aquatilis]PWR20354.1 CsbD family protein [Zavarzinia aquatilis]
MNWDTVKGNWKHTKGLIKEKWGELTDDDLTRAEGRKDQLIGRIQERYGRTREAAEREVDHWLKSLH